MLSAEAARTIILGSVHPLGLTSLSIQRASGYVIGESVTASDDVPPFDNSAMDGYAVRSEDIAIVPVELPVVGEVPAGAIARRLHGGETMAIMTGAKIPEGSNAVIQQEWTQQITETRIRVMRSVPAGHNIRRAGRDVERESVVFEPGRQIRPQEIGVLASLGKQFITVYRKPSVAILATGNELAAIDRPLPEGMIRNSNSYTLAALAGELGCEVSNVGIARDTKDEVRELIVKGLHSDILITSGGVSVGKYDLVIDVLKELGVDIRFWKVNIKPGMPLLFGMWKDRPVFGLPGNPVSTVVTFLQFVRPAILRMMGMNNPIDTMRLHAVLEHDITKSDGKRHFIRGVMENRNGSLTVRSTGSQLSNIMSSLLHANCLIILPEECEAIRAGGNVEVELLP